MIISPYESIAARSYKLDNIEDSIRQELIEGALFRGPSPRSFFITQNEMDVKAFPHPLVLDRANRGNSDIDSDKIIIGDARPYAKIHKNENRLVGGADFEYLKQRITIMDTFWLDNNQRDLMTLSDFPMTIYTTLLSESAGKKLRIDEDIIEVMRIFFAYFYISLFLSKDELEAMDDVAISKRIARGIRRPFDDVYDIVGMSETPQGLKHLLEQMKDYTQSSRIEKLNPATLFKIFGGVWFGPQATEQVAVSLEHPPTFFAMLDIAIRHKGYQKTVLSKLVRNLDKRKEYSQEFVNILHRNLEYVE